MVDDGSPNVIPLPPHAIKGFSELRKEEEKKRPRPKPKGPKRPKLEATETVIWLALRNEPELYQGELFKLDTFSGQTMLMHPVPVPSVLPPHDFKPRAATDNDITHMMVWLQSNNFVKASVPRVSRAIDVEAERNKFSSAKQAIEALPAWDGEKRLDHFWIDVCGSIPGEPGMSTEQIKQRGDYLSATARCFFISIIARVMRPGCKADFSPILEGSQGTKKSTLLRIIALDRDEWFSDCLPRDLGNKDARSHLAGKLVVELAEMHQMKGTQVETLKTFLTVDSDKFRPSYGRLDIVLKRQCVFVGTTNASSYFRDETGNRRFWPVPCGEIDIDLARKSMLQIYAEARAAYLAGEHWWLPPEIEALAEIEQDERISADPWDELVAEVVNKARNAARLLNETFFWVQTNDALLVTQTPIERWTPENQGRVQRILRKLGGKNKRMPRRGGDQKWGYQFITAKNQPQQTTQPSQDISKIEF